MPRRPEQPFPWRGVVLIALAFALIGLAVLFRGFDASAASRPIVRVPSWSDVTTLVRFFGVALVVVMRRLWAFAVATCM